jgi:hypothetical protein
LKKDVLDNVVDWYALMKLETLRKQRPDPLDNDLTAASFLP